VDVSKIVRSRLRQKAVQPPDGHPDSDLLAAFAERNLLERERAEVSAHLAECADCREYLALAFATLEPEGAEGTRPQRASVRHWFQTWRWFVTAAAACCVVGVALQYYVQPPPLEKQRPADIIPSQVSSRKTPPVSSDIPQVPSANRRKVEHQAVKPLRQVLVLNRPTALEQPALQARGKDNAPKPAEDVAVASSTETAAASEYSVVPEASTSTALLPMNRDASEKKKRALATPRMKLAMADAIVSQAAAKTFAAPAILWSINTSPEALATSFGVVQRSRDRGKTWEVIPLSDRVSFRAVTASGNEVWAGGSNGALFHSSDGGSRWVQIAISEEAAKPTGTIVSIDAHDPNQLKITTSSGDQWTSTDGGWHWRQE
jgi:hypothetical protein